MTTKETYKYNFPAHCLGALFNGDTSGLDEKDEKQLDDFLKRESHIDTWNMQTQGGEIDHYFSISPEFGLPCDCVKIMGIVWL